MCQVSSFVRLGVIRSRRCRRLRSVFHHFGLVRSWFAFVSPAQKMLIVWDDKREYCSLAVVSESSFFALLRLCSRAVLFRRPPAAFACVSHLFISFSLCWSFPAASERLLLPRFCVSVAALLSQAAVGEQFPH